MSDYFFRLAKLTDQREITTFIKNYWKADHIYVLDNLFFEYEFKDFQNLNFILTFNLNNVLSGILGFIKYNSEINEQIFTVMWKVIPNVSDPMLGIKLFKKLIELYPNANFSTVGANEKTLKIYQYLGFKTGKLDHFVLINRKVSNFRIIKFIKTTDIYSTYIDNNIDMYSLTILTSKQISNFFLNSTTLDNSVIKEFKSFHKRYIKHPYYKYIIYGIISTNNDILNILVIRELEINQVKIARVINIIGNPSNLINVKSALINLVEINMYEYLDFYQYGIKDEILFNSGFIKKNSNNIIVPNYFEPFVSKTYIFLDS